MDLGIPLTVLRGHTKPVTSIYSINDFIFSADDAGCLVVWKVDTETKSKSLEFITVAELKAKEPICAVSVTCEPGHQNLVIFLQLKCGKVKVYSFSIDNFQFRFVEDFEIGKFTFCRTSTLSKYLAYPDEGVENAVNIIDLESDTIILKSFLPSTSASGMCLFTKLYPSIDPLNQNTKILALFGYETGRIVILHVNLLELNSFETVFEGKVLEESCTDADYNPLTGSIVVVGAGKEIKVLQNIWIPTSSEFNVQIPFAGCNSVAIRSDGKLFVTAGWDAKIRFFSLKSGKPLAILEHHFDLINCVLINSDNYTLAASADGTISVCAYSLGQSVNNIMVIEANFAVPIVKTFPSPLKGVHLFLNSLQDLSLYREIGDNGGKKSLVHAWSLGRFKSLLKVTWAPNGKLLAVLCTKKCFIYSAEDGQKVGSIPAFPQSTVLWHLMGGGEESTTSTSASTLLLTLVDLVTFKVKWSVNGEFELLSNKLCLQESDGPICSIKFNSSSDLVIIQSQSQSQPQSQSESQSQHQSQPQSQSQSHSNNRSSQISLPFTKHHLISDLAQLSRNIQTFSRSLDDLKDHFSKLLKFSDFVMKSVSASESESESESTVSSNSNSNSNSNSVISIKKFILFGGEVQFTAVPPFTETELLEWKGKLKKQHAELLVQIQVTSKISSQFSHNFSSFSNSTNIERFSVEFLPKFEDEIRSIQRDLADFFIWIEPIIIKDSHTTSTSTTTRIIINPVRPDSRALDLVSALFHTNSEDRGKKWTDFIDELKNNLSTDFKNLIADLTNFNTTTTHFTDDNVVFEVEVETDVDKSLCSNLIISNQNQNNKIIIK